MLMQAGSRRPKARRSCSALDMTKVKDPFPYMNIIIGQINEQKSDEALALIGKLMTQFPTEMTALLLPRARQPRGEEAARGQGRPREVRRRVRRRPRASCRTRRRFSSR